MSSASSASSEGEDDPEVQPESRKRKADEESDGSDTEASAGGKNQIPKKPQIANEDVDPGLSTAAKAAGLNIEDYIDPEHDAKRTYNRASAAKSRAKKQKQLEQLQVAVDKEEDLYENLLKKNRASRKEIAEMINLLMKAVLAGVMLPDQVLLDLFDGESDGEETILQMKKLLEFTGSQPLPSSQETPAEMIARILTSSGTLQTDVPQDAVDARASQQQQGSPPTMSLQQGLANTSIPPNTTNPSSSSSSTTNNTTQSLLLALLQQQNQQSHLLSVQQAGTSSGTTAAHLSQSLPSEDAKSRSDKKEGPNS